MATVICPECREALDIPDHQLNGPVRCGACQAVFDPPAPDRPARRPVADESDDRPPRRRPPKRSGFPVWLLLLVVGGLVLGCGCCGGFTLLVVRMMNPDFQPFDAPDGSFAARFPDGPPDPTKPPTGRKLGETATGFEHTRTMLGTPYETYFAYTVPLTADDRGKPSAAVAASLADGLKATQAGATEQLPRRTQTHGGHDGVVVILRHKDGKFTQARAVVAGDRGYVFGVTGPGQPGGSPWVEEFLDGFQIKGPADGPKAEAPAVEVPKAVPAKPKATGPRREPAPPPRAKPVEDE